MPQRHNCYYWSYRGLSRWLLLLVICRKYCDITWGYYTSIIWQMPRQNVPVWFMLLLKLFLIFRVLLGHINKHALRIIGNHQRNYGTVVGTIWLCVRCSAHRHHLTRGRTIRVTTDPFGKTICELINKSCKNTCSSYMTICGPRPSWCCTRHGTWAVMIWVSLVSKLESK